VSVLDRLGRTLIFLLAAAAVSCSTSAIRRGWEGRLHGDAVIFLGEVHDNAKQHELRLALLERAFAAGWRPAIVMEQFDREHQADIERARREHPTDPQHVIDLAAPVTAGSGGWNWDFYRPYVALALRYNVPLIAANLSRSDASRVAEHGYSAVFSPAQQEALRLNRPIAPDWQAAQEREIKTGHCNALPADLVEPMTRAQLARDAVMAAVVTEHARGGVVLLAGDGHVRRDIGVPRWLSPSLAPRVFTVGYLEEGDPLPADAFDATVYTSRAQRIPPCRQFEPRQERRRPTQRPQARGRDWPNALIREQFGN